MKHFSYKQFIAWKYAISPLNLLVEASFSSDDYEFLVRKGGGGHWNSRISYIRIMVCLLLEDAVVMEIAW